MQHLAMKVKARLSESGQQVEAARDADWALVHPPAGQRRPILFCPERICDNRVTAVEIVHPAGPTTRFFRFIHGSPTCEHSEVPDPVVIEQPVIEQTVVEPHGETPEHRWLKEYVRRVALDLGHRDVELEVNLNDRVRADVFLPEVLRGRVEIQRGPTNVPDRTESFAEVVWLLRAAFNESNKRYLFTCPCVQVRVVRREAGRPVLAEPWADGRGAEVRATGTVLQARAVPDSSDPFGFFENEKNVDLAAFLADVWSGRRRWHPQLTAHRFAGWITVEDFVRYESWRRPPAPQPAPEPELPESLPLSPAPTPGPDPAAVEPSAPAELTSTPIAVEPREVRPDAPSEEVSRPERTWWSRLRRWLFGPR